MLRRSRFSRTVILSLFAGLLAGLLSASRAEITYPCPPPPDDPSASCLAMEKAITHPSDLWSNVQGSRTDFIRYFLEVFAIVFVVVLALLLIVHTVRAARARRRSRAVTS